MKKHLFAAIAVVLLFSTLTLLPSCGKDDDNPTTCDTTDVSYANDIAPIISKNCSDAACHGGATPGSTFRLDNYPDLKSAVPARKIVEALKHQSGVSPMPKDKDKLPDCEISLIEAWIVQGAKDN